MKNPEPQVPSDPARDRERVIEILARILAKSWLRNRDKEQAESKTVIQNSDSKKSGEAIG